MKRNHISKTLRVGQAALISASILLGIQAVGAAGASEDTFVCRAHADSPGSVGGFGALINRASAHNSAMGVAAVESIGAADAQQSITVPGARKVGAGETVGANPVAPSPARLLATTCLLGFVGYRKRRSVLAVWKGRRASRTSQIAQQLWLLAYLILAGLEAAACALSAGKVRR